MSIEQRIADALLDLEGLLIEGNSPELAIATAASAFGIRPEVLEARAKKQLGDLNQFKARCDCEAANLRRASLIKNALYRFSSSLGSEIICSDVVKWVENDLNIVLTADEMLLAYEARNEAFHRRVIRDIGFVPPAEANF